jgi:hypothetical protein
MACTITANRQEGIMEHVVDGNSRDADVRIIRFIRLSRLVPACENADMAGQYLDCRTGVVDGRRQRPRGHFRHGDQRQPRVLIKGAPATSHECVADRLCLVFIDVSGCVGEPLAERYEGARQRCNGYLTLVPCNLRQGLHVDELHVAGAARQHGRCAGWLAARIAFVASAAKTGLLAKRLHGLDSLVFDPVKHIAEPAKPHQKIDPADQHEHDEPDHQNGHDEQDQPAGTAIDTGLQKDDANNGVDEGANERRQHVLRNGIVEQQVGGARRGGRSGRGIGGDHGGE